MALRATSRDATRTRRPTWPNVVETTTAVEVMGRYSNPDIVACLTRILSGQGRDRPSHRPVPSLTQKQTRLTNERLSELILMHARGVPIDELASVFDIHRTTVMTHLDRASVDRRTGLIDRHLTEARISTNRAHPLLELPSALVSTVKPCAEPSRTPGSHFVLVEAGSTDWNCRGRMTSAIRFGSAISVDVDHVLAGETRSSDSASPLSTAQERVGWRIAVVQDSNLRPSGCEQLYRCSVSCQPMWF